MFKKIIDFIFGPPEPVSAETTLLNSVEEKLTAQARNQRSDQITTFVGNHQSNLNQDVTDIIERAKAALKAEKTTVKKTAAKKAPAKAKAPAKKAVAKKKARSKK